MAGTARDELLQRLLDDEGLEASDEIPSSDGPYWVRFRGGGRWRGAWLEDGWAHLGDQRVAPSALEWGPPIE